MDRSQSQLKSKPPIARAVDSFVDSLARNWLNVFNVLWGTYVLLPLLAPVLMELGLMSPARWIYSIYSFACHQLPDHSYFFFGENNYLAPTLGQLESGGMTPGLHFFEQRRFLGNEVVGYKTAICQRDLAIYGAVLIAGLLYKYWNPNGRRLDWRFYILLLLPMAIDGGTQLIGLRESTWLLRSMTGALFGFASVWFAYPHIQSAMQEVLEEPSY